MLYEGVRQVGGVPRIRFVAPGGITYCSRNRGGEKSYHAAHALHVCLAAVLITITEVLFTLHMVRYVHLGNGTRQILRLEKWSRYE